MRILLLGASVMQGPAIRTAKDMGCYVIVADGDVHAPMRSLADEFVHIDLRDTEALVTYAQGLCPNLDGVFTAGTDFSYAVACIAQACNLPGISVEAAYNASNKMRMRMCFERAGMRVPRYMQITRTHTVDALVKMIEPIGFPCVIKPVDNMGARGIRMVRTRAELPDALEQVWLYTATHYAIIEEYIDAPEYSIDAIIRHDILEPYGIALRHIGYPPYFIEYGHSLPASLTKNQETALLTVMKKGAHALGIDTGVVKGDIFMHQNGEIIICEMAARLSGGYMSGWTYPYSSGVNSTRIALELALGIVNKPQRARYQLHSVERAILSIDGTIRQYEIAPPLSDSVAIQYEFFSGVSIGASVCFPRNNVEKCGNVIVTAQTFDAAHTLASYQIAHSYLWLEPYDERTLHFLINSAMPCAYPQLYAYICTHACGDYSLFIDNMEEDMYDISFELSSIAHHLYDECDWHFRSVKQSLNYAVQHGWVRFCESCALDDPFIICVYSAFAKGGLIALEWLYQVRLYNPQLWKKACYALIEIMQ